MDMAKEVMKDKWEGEWHNLYVDQEYTSETPHLRRWCEHLRKYVFDKFNKRNPAYVLELGCGAGHRWWALNDKKFYMTYTGMDYSRSQLDQFASNEQAKQSGDKIRLMHHDLDNSLPFEDNSFDLVFTAGCLMHLYPDTAEKVLNEMLRVSRKYVSHSEENKFTAANILNGYDLPHFYSSIDPNKFVLIDEHFVHPCVGGWNKKVANPGHELSNTQVIIFDCEGISGTHKLTRWYDYHERHGHRMIDLEKQDV